MAQKLLADATHSAYAGVEAFARRHPQRRCRALAWLSRLPPPLRSDYAKGSTRQGRRPAPDELGGLGPIPWVIAYLKTVHKCRGAIHGRGFQQDIPIHSDASPFVYASPCLLKAARGAADCSEKDRCFRCRADVEIPPLAAPTSCGRYQKRRALSRNLYQPSHPFRGGCGGNRVAQLGVSGSVAERPRARISIQSTGVTATGPLITTT